MYLVLSYLDPGAGSMLLQVILASVLGLGITLKAYGRRILGFFHRNKENDANATEASSKDESR